MLEIKDIDVFYGDIQVIDKVSIKVSEGELVAIFGPNGHGKSTLLKTVCGICRSRSGYIKYNGIEISKLPTEKIVELGLVYIPEEWHLFNKMTVIENLKIGAYNINARQNKDMNLNYVFTLFPILKERSEQLAYTLSGGQRRMLAIGLALMSSPKFLMLDEPSLGLAPNTRVDLFNRIAEIKRSGISMLLVEENVLLASKIADRFYVIEDGKIKLEGYKEDILTNKYLRSVYLGTKF